MGPKIAPCSTPKMIFCHELNLDQFLLFPSDFIHSFEEVLNRTNKFCRHAVSLSIGSNWGNQKVLINISLVHQMLCFYLQLLYKFQESLTDTGSCRCYSTHENQTGTLKKVLQKMLKVGFKQCVQIF